MLITFVCTGNTCRSAMAEGICNRIIKDRNIKNVSCQSCGLAAYTGDEASVNAVLAAKKHGADISSHRSRMINEYILSQTDIMVCMTENHKKAVLGVKPHFKIFVPQNGISDPYGGDIAVYEKCADELESYIKKLLDALTVTIVPMSEGHIKEIAELEKACFSSPWSENGIKTELSDNTAHFLVALSNEKVLGYIGVHEVCKEAYIANIAVYTSYRRLGIGEELLKTAQEGAKKRECEFISLEVRKSNLSAIELYKKQGYNIAGERKKFYSAPEEDALIMTLTLKECESK